MLFAAEKQKSKDAGKNKDQKEDYILKEELDSDIQEELLIPEEKLREMEQKIEESLDDSIPVQQERKLAPTEEKLQSQELVVAPRMGVGENLTVLVVKDLMPLGVDGKIAKSVTDIVREELIQSGLYSVYRREEVDSLLIKMNFKEKSGCYTEKCLVKLGNVLAAEKIVNGTLEKLGNIYTLSLSLLDVQAEAVDNAITYSCECKENQFSEMARNATLRLLGLEFKSDEVKTVEVKEPIIHRETSWIISTATTLVGGLIYAILDKALYPEDQNSNVPTRYTSIYRDDNLSHQAGAFANIGFGARPLGMGNAFAGLADDASGVAFNPAGIVRGKNREFQIYYTKQFQLIPYTYMAFIDRIQNRLSHGQAIVASGDEAFNELTFISGISYLYDKVPGGFRPVSAGLNIKLQMGGFGNNTGGGNEKITGKMFGVGLDLGLQFEITQKILMGIMVRNIFNYLKWHNDYRDLHYNQGLPPELIIAGSFKVNPTTTLVMDGKKSIYLDTRDRVSLGAEKIIFNMVALRTGGSLDMETETNLKLNFGLGFFYGFSQNRRVSFDYAYEFFKTVDHSHRISLGTRF